MSYIIKMFLMAVRFSVAVIGLKGGNAISHSNQSTPHNNLLSKTH
jgi:hypothetical protein